MNTEDIAFIERHARDYWLIEVENNDVMARTYGYWYRLSFGNGTLKDCPKHSWATREFRSQIPFA